MTGPEKFVASHQIISDDVDLGEGVRIASFVNLYGCSIGDGTKIGSFVEVQRGATIGARCKISSHTFVCGGVTIEDECFVGHGVTFINDLHPRATTADGRLKADDDWELVPTRIGKRSSIGSGATILGGVEIGEGAVIGAGAVVSADVPDGMLAVGVPARVIRRVADDEGQVAGE
ncbi:MAG: acyltransferase [Acidimicrobiia bacterium]|nr:MAG: acyltransferase [Acidimicrobiia bacterium]